MSSEYNQAEDFNPITKLNPLTTNEEQINYRFGFLNHWLSKRMTISIIGHETKMSTSYYWDGLTRKDRDNYIFQYTISGCGILEIDGKVHKITAGKAFFVEIPSNHRYYFPEGQEEWEFIFITLKGEEVKKFFEDMIEFCGPIMEVSPDCQMIKCLFKTYKETHEGEIKDPYKVSARAYEFVMESYRFAKNLDNNKQVSEELLRALNFIQTSFDQPITVEEVAAISGLSKYYFIRKFLEEVGSTPKQYMTNLKIQHSLELLLDTDLTVKEIAAKVGFSNDNYFNKAFRKKVGSSPGAFRKNHERLPFSKIIT